MSVKNGQVADENTFNDGYLDKNEDTTTKFKVSLESDEVEDGAYIGSVQKAVNKSFDTSGIAAEDDANAKIYANTNYIADGDNRKVAIEKLDAQSKVNADNIQQNTDDIAQGGTDLTNHVDNYGAHKEEDTLANLQTFALTADNGTICYATDTKEYYFVKDTLLASMGGSTFKPVGTWDASTNTPALPTGLEQNGEFFTVTTAGTQDLGNGPIDWNVDDWAIFFTGTGYEKIENSGTVKTVNSVNADALGNVAIEADDIPETVTRYWDIKHNRNAVAEPTVSNDDTENYSVGSRWLIPADEVEFVCLDNSTGFAVWEQISGSGAGSLSVWGSIKAEGNKLKNWTALGTGVLTVQEIEVASGKSSYQLDILASGDGAEIVIPATSGAIETVTNGLRLIAKNVLADIEVSILDASDDSVMESYDLEELAEWNYSKRLFNFPNTFVGPNIKVQLKSLTGELGTIYFDQIELDSDPMTMGNSVQTETAWFRDRQNGSSLNTDCVWFDVELENTSGHIVDILNDSIEGFRVIAKQNCTINISYNGQATDATTLLYLNPTDAEKDSVTTAENDLDKILARGRGQNSTPYPYAQANVSKDFKKGDEIYLIMASSASNGREFITVSATANHKQVFFEGKTKDLDEIWFNVDDAGNITDSKYEGNNGVSIIGWTSGYPQTQNGWAIDCSSLNLTVEPSVDAIFKTTGVTVGMRDVGYYYDIPTKILYIGMGDGTVFKQTGFSVTIKKNAPDLKGITQLSTGANVVSQDQVKKILVNSPLGVNGRYAELEFTGLEIGEDYELSGIVTLLDGGTTDSNTIEVRIENGSQLVWQGNPGSTGSSSGTYPIGVSSKFTATDDELTFTRIATGNGRIGGESGSGQTRLTLSKRNKGNFIGYAGKHNYTSDGLERAIVGEFYNGKQVFERTYENVSGILDVLSTGLIPVNGWARSSTLTSEFTKTIVVGAGTLSSELRAVYDNSTGSLFFVQSNFDMVGIPFTIEYTYP